MSTSSSPWDVDIGARVADRHAFSEFVYTPVREAIEELKRLREDKKLGDTISELLHNDILSILVGPSIKTILFRQLVTPQTMTGNIGKLTFLMGRGEKEEK